MNQFKNQTERCYQYRIQLSCPLSMAVPTEIPFPCQRCFPLSTPSTLPASIGALRGTSTFRAHWLPIHTALGWSKTDPAPSGSSSNDHREPKESTTWAHLVDLDTGWACAGHGHLSLWAPEKTLLAQSRAQEHQGWEKGRAGGAGMREKGRKWGAYRIARLQTSSRI